MSEEQNTPTKSPPEKQPQIANIPPSNQETVQRKKSNKWPIIGLTIFALTALGVTGVFAYQNYQLKQKDDSQKDNPVISPKPTEAPLPTPTSDPTANWLTFTQKDICYSFKYPQEIAFNDEDIVRLSLVGPTQKEDTEFYDGLSLTFSLPLKIGNLSLNDYVDDKIEEVEKGGVAEITKSKKAVLVNEINGYTFTVQGLGTFQNIFLQSLDKTCTVEITNATIDPTNQGYQQTIDKILSTFKFVD